MMSLTNLPEEILIIIIQQLDTKSIRNLFYTCRRLKNTISMTGVVKECYMSMNTLATATSLKTDFFKAIAPHLVELNLSGVPDLRKSNLMPAMKKMRNLQTLDVSFTNINLPDFLDIYSLCPTIKNVSLNFMVTKSDISRIADDTILQFQEVFENFRCVHFVGSATNLLYSRLPFLLLKACNLDCLKYTIAESDRLQTIYVPVQAKRACMVHFKRFFICFLDWTPINASYFSLRCLSMLDLFTIESIFIIKQNFKHYSIYASPIFQTYLQENFNVPPDKINRTELTDSIIGKIIGNTAIMIWNKETHDFNDKFFRELHKILKQMVSKFCSKKSVPEKYEWFYITPEPADRADNNCEKPPPPYEFRRRRTAPPINVLNYDELFKTKKRVQLSLIFDEFLRNPITLPTHCDYLQKLTFLSMTGAVRMSADFFKILFKNCDNLVTVSIDSPSIHSCVLPVSRAIHLSPGLKNLRLIDKRTDFRLLFPSLAECKTLENVHIEDLTMGETFGVGDPSVLIDECPNLYSLFIQSPLSEANRIRMTQILLNVKISRNKHHLNLMLHVNSGLSRRRFYSYDPFLSVFNLHPIKHIEAF